MLGLANTFTAPPAGVLAAKAAEPTNNRVPSMATPSIAFTIRISTSQVSTVEQLIDALSPSCPHRHVRLAMRSASSLWNCLALHNPDVTLSSLLISSFVIFLL